MSPLLVDLLFTNLGTYLRFYLRSLGRQPEDVVRLRLSSQAVIVGVDSGQWAIQEGSPYIMVAMVCTDGSVVVHVFHKANIEQAVQ